MKFSITHHAGQATTTQLGQRLSPLNFRLFALPLICEMESSKITIKEFRQRGAVAMCGFMRCLWAAPFRLMAKVKPAPSRHILTIWDQFVLIRRFRVARILQIFRRVVLCDRECKAKLRQAELVIFKPWKRA